MKVGELTRRKPFVNVDDNCTFIFNVENIKEHLNTLNYYFPATKKLYRSYERVYGEYILIEFKEK
jgi:hypothetical protein